MCLLSQKVSIIFMQSYTIRSILWRVQNWILIWVVLRLSKLVPVYAAMLVTTRDIHGTSTLTVFRDWLLALNAVVVGLVVRRVGSLRSDVDVGGIYEGGVSIFHRAWSHSEKERDSRLGSRVPFVLYLWYYNNCYVREYGPITIVNIVESLPEATRSLSLIIT